MSNAASSVCFHAFVSTCAFVFLLSGYLAVELLDCMLNFNCQSESESRSAVSSSVTALDYTVLGIPQGKTLEWVAFPFSRGSSQPRDRTPFSHIAGRFFTRWATREAPVWKREYSYFEVLITCWNGCRFNTFSSVQFSHSVVSWLFATPWTAARQASLSITNSRSLLKL